MLNERAGPRLSAEALGVTCRDATGVTGAGLMLMDGNTSRGSVATTDDVSTLIEELQFDLGEGPCIDAYRQDRPVAEPNLANPAVPRWLAFTPPALAAGARAVFGFPLQVGAVRLGALNLYCTTPGPLSSDQHTDAIVMASVAAHALLLMQSNAPEGVIAAELEAGSNFHPVVHQASGMIAVQLGVDLAEALVRLRAYAFAREQSVTQVSDDVVNRRLRFSTSSEEEK